MKKFLFSFFLCPFSQSPTGWMDGWMDGRMNDGQTDGTDEQMSESGKFYKEK